MALMICLTVFVLLIYITIFALCKAAALEDEYFEYMAYSSKKKAS